MAAVTDDVDWLPPTAAEQLEYRSRWRAARTQLADFQRRAERRAPVFLALWTSGRRRDAAAHFRALDPDDGCSVACGALAAELLFCQGQCDADIAEALLRTHRNRNQDPSWAGDFMAKAVRTGRSALFDQLSTQLRRPHFYGSSLAEAVVLSDVPLASVMTMRGAPLAVARAAAALGRREAFDCAFNPDMTHSLARTIVKQGWVEELEAHGVWFEPLALAAADSAAVLARMLDSPVLRPMLIARCSFSAPATPFDVLACRKRRNGQQLAAQLLAALSPDERALLADTTLGHPIANLAHRIAGVLYMPVCPRPATAALMLDVLPWRPDPMCNVARAALWSAAHRPLAPYQWETFRMLMNHDSVTPLQVADVLKVARADDAELRCKAAALKAGLSLQRCGRATAAERAELVEAVGPELAPLARMFGAWGRRGPLLLVRALAQQGRATAVEGSESAEGFVARAPGAVVRAVVSFL